MAEKRKLDPHFVELSKAFLPGEYTDAAGNRIWYRLFAPALEEKKEYPLVVFLHGAGERGEDNDIQVAGNRGAVVWTEASEQADRPCYVLAPRPPRERISPRRSSRRRSWPSWSSLSGKIRWTASGSTSRV